MCLVSRASLIVSCGGGMSISRGKGEILVDTLRDDELRERRGSRYQISETACLLYVCTRDCRWMRIAMTMKELL